MGRFLIWILNFLLWNNLHWICSLLRFSQSNLRILRLQFIIFIKGYYSRTSHSAISLLLNLSHSKTKISLYILFVIERLLNDWRWLVWLCGVDTLTKSWINVLSNWSILWLWNLRFVFSVNQFCQFLKNFKSFFSVRRFQLLPQ